MVLLDKQSFDIILIPGVWVNFYSRTINPVVGVEFHSLESWSEFW